MYICTIDTTSRFTSIDDAHILQLTAVQYYGNRSLPSSVRGPKLLIRMCQTSVPRPRTIWIWPEPKRSVPIGTHRSLLRGEGESSVVAASYVPPPDLYPPPPDAFCNPGYVRTSTWYSYFFFVPTAAVSCLQNACSSKGQTCSDVCQYSTPRTNTNTNRYCLLYTSPSPRDQRGSRMPSSA